MITQTLPAVLKCRICDDAADGQHFGVDACRACAAFFRRTIARDLKYICRFENSCEISKVYRCMCRSCRLQKCFESGMKRESVQISRTSGPGANSRRDIPSTSANIRRPKRIVVKEDPEEPIPGTSSVNHQSVSSVNSNSRVENTCLEEMLGNVQLDEEQRKVSNKNVLRQIVEISATDYFVDPTSLPRTHPILRKIQYGYELLQRRRDELYLNGRISCNVDGRTTRTYIEKSLDLLEYAQNNRRELNFIGEMLVSAYQGYAELPTSDKISLFKNFWTNFLILERSYDTFRILGPSLDDLRMVFSYGIVMDAINNNVDCVKVSNLSVAETGRLIRTWWKQAALKILPPMKTLEPTEIEMMFCFGFLLFNLGDKVSKVSLATSEFCHKMVNTLYDELFAYYLSEFPGQNYVKRVGELMRFNSTTEKIVNDRKEDILVCQMFKVFKADIFLDEIFNDA
ncbi:ligand-binding domain of nuclear hormone receptor domain-containing protein [Ditylenchus destructor]|uniref:Ligand-binding domain of nuclear hormone receptor domain-containing protein n=1 Tax=Ditylenchus destructor TaxID=166010 RepID=A0AAD4R0T9_9BILA|nr:ligand-binding domain of nuclear hormone receptor domain-containing protein [Ditylenchus destructor]